MHADAGRLVGVDFVDVRQYLPLNEGHTYTYERDTLVNMLDRAPANARSLND